jgi:Gluconate 2-dehydrogenase subunit 3
MATWLTDDEYRTVVAMCERLIPADDTPGATDAGVADYIDGLLGAFSFDPPRIWAGGPSSGRFGGTAGFSRFHPLTALDELAWRTRIEG